MSRRKRILAALILFVALFVVIIQTNKEDGESIYDKMEKRHNARYEQMINVEGMGTLNQKTLEEDHKSCVEDEKDFEANEKDTSKTIMPMLIILFLIIIVTTYESRKPIKSIISLVVVFLILVGSIASTNRSIRRDTSYLDESYRYVEEKIKSKKDVYDEDKYKHIYTLYTEDGKTLEVEEYLFNRVEDMGIYYLGETESGTVLSLYPSSKFILEEK